MSCPKGPDICYVRGDTATLTLNFTRSGSPENLTGFTSWLLTVNASDEPADVSEQQFQLDGVFATDGSDGAVDFLPQGVDENARRTASEAYTPGDFFYDVQADDASGRRVTLLLGGKFEVKQDINKG